MSPGLTLRQSEREIWLVYRLTQQLLSLDELEKRNIKLQDYEYEEMVTPSVAVTAAVGNFVRPKLYFA